jgi:hypothetical protein
MAPAVSAPDILLYAGIVTILIIAAIIYLVVRSRAAKQASATMISTREPGGIPRHRLDYQPDARPVSPLKKPRVSKSVEPPAAHTVPKTMSVVDGRTDIADSTRALAEKYALAGFTLATTDGLVFSSSGNPDATEDAAQFGGMAVPAGPGSPAGVTLFALSFRGIGLTGIIRSNRQPTSSVLRMIEQDTQEILNRWI